MASKKIIFARIIEHYGRMQRTVAAGKKYHQQYLSEVEAAYEDEVERAHSKYDAQVMDVERVYQTQLTAVQTTISQASQELGTIAATWDAECWEEELKVEKLFQQNTNTLYHVPGGVRVGKLLVPHIDIGETPALVPLLGQGHLFVVSRGSTKDRALELLQSIVTRTIVTFPALSGRFTLIDPLGEGGNFPFNKRLPETICGNTVYCEADEIRTQLREMTEHLRRVQIKYLARDYENIERYNEDAEEVVEPYRFLCISDFPSKFDSNSATRLLSIAEKGVRTGVYILMHINADEEPPREFNMDALLRTGTVIDADNEGFVFPLGEKRYFFIPDHIPPKNLFNNLMDKVAEEAKSGGFVGIPFKKIAIPLTDWWSADSRKMINVPVGRTGARDALEFWLGEKNGRISSHALVGGRTGSGKSTLFHVLIASLATIYHPDEIELYLVDFKEGVEFKPYADAALPHARVVAIESEREFGLSVLIELKSELERRGELFKQVNAQDLFTYRERTGNLLPRLILIVDEFQVLLAEQDQITRRASLILEDLARRGRVFGINLILGSQSFRGVDITSSALGQFATRVVLQAPEAEVAFLLSPDNVTEATLLERPGELIYNDDGGRRDRNQPGQVALLREKQLTELLENVKNFSQEQAFHRHRPQVVFRGNEGTDLGGNVLLQYLYDLPEWPSVQDIKTAFELREWIATEQPALGWLGESIEIRPHTAAVFRRRNRANLLLIGDEEETIFGMFGGLFLSLAGFHAPNSVQFHIIDLGLSNEGWSEACNLFAQEFEFHQITIQQRRDASRMIEQVSQMVQLRHEQYQDGHDALGPSLYFFVAGAHRLPELRPIPGRFGQDEISDYGTKLIDIIQKGPEVGVHTILWYESVKSFDYGLRRTTLGYFDRRVALPMSVDDSQYLLREPVAGRLPRYRAYLLDEEQSEPLEKFKPYLLPTAVDGQAELFQRYAGRLRHRLEY